jgi:RNA polymerase sigma factor (sigma-70 family)
MSSHRETELGGSRGSFQPTAWTQVLGARDGLAAEARSAWDQLVDVYWKPVYFQVRRKGHNVEDAKDLTQQFFTSLLERGALKAVDPAKGKFRTFVRACLEHFLSDQYDHRKALKRRSPLDVGEAETQFSMDRDFERDWALTVLERAFVALREETPREARVVEAQRSGEMKLAQLAGELDVSEANVKVLAHRGRKRLRECILRELRATVLEPGAEADELRDLFEAFSL